MAILTMMILTMMILTMTILMINHTETSWTSSPPPSYSSVPVVEIRDIIRTDKIPFGGNDDREYDLERNSHHDKIPWSHDVFSMVRCKK